MISFREHISGLFVAGVYFWLVGDELGADTCWETANTLLDNTITLTIMVA
jgi:hypothetical protein